MQMRTTMTLLGLLLSVGCTSALDDVSDDAVVDSDGDGYIDTMDGCPDDIVQWTDVDGDGYCDEIDDACPDDPNEWTDTDGDGVCDTLTRVRKILRRRPTQMETACAMSEMMRARMTQSLGGTRMVTSPATEPMIVQIPRGNCRYRWGWLLRCEGRLSR